MSLMNYGYKKEEIQIRKMTMAELRLGIVQELLKKNYRYVNIRLVNTTCGDVDSYRSTEDFLRHVTMRGMRSTDSSKKKFCIMKNQKSVQKSE